MGESTTPGCLAGSSGAAIDSATGCGAGAVVARGAGAAAATLPRATRTRWPFCSISISVRPVSSSSLVSSWISAWSTSGVVGDVLDDFAIELTLTFHLAHDLIRKPVPTFRDHALAFVFGADQSGEPGDRQRIAADAEAADHRSGRLRHI